jgi:hypothetical protein
LPFWRRMAAQADEERIKALQNEMPEAMKYYRKK